MNKNNFIRTISVYGDLVKYRLSLAVTFSSVTGYFISRNTLEASLFFLIPGVFFLASGSAVLNQYSESEFDALMTRTNQRPLPKHMITGKAALLIAAAFFCCGILFLSLTGLISLILGVFNVLLYNIVYTRLKRVTALAIIPGSLVGAIPPLIGYLAAGTSTMSNEIIFFSAFMFLWQLPHFWLILLKYHEEYEKAGFVTLFQLANEQQIKVLVFFWVLITTLMLIIFSISGIAIDNHLVLVLIPLNIIFIFSFYFSLFRKTEKTEIRGAFILVNSFSLLIMILFIINSFLS
jgi:protoheme IX farnesyltransferase